MFRGEAKQTNRHLGLIPFQTKIFLSAPLSRMKQSFWESMFCLNGFLSATKVVFMDPAASETWKRELIQHLLYHLALSRFCNINLKAEY